MGSGRELRELGHVGRRSNQSQPDAHGWVDGRDRIDSHGDVGRREHRGHPLCEAHQSGVRRGIVPVAGLEPNEGPARMQFVPEDHVVAEKYAQGTADGLCMDRRDVATGRFAGD